VTANSVSSWVASRILFRAASVLPEASGAVNEIHTHLAVLIEILSEVLILKMVIFARNRTLSIYASIKPGDHHSLP
jgi:hypothetical protein